MEKNNFDYQSFLDEISNNDNNDVKDLNYFLEKENFGLNDIDQETKDIIEKTFVLKELNNKKPNRISLTPKSGYNMLLNGKIVGEVEIYGEGVKVFVEKFIKGLNRNDTSLKVVDSKHKRIDTIETIKIDNNNNNNNNFNEIKNSNDIFNKFKFTEDNREILNEFKSIIKEETKEDLDNYFRDYFKKSFGIKNLSQETIDIMDKSFDFKDIQVNNIGALSISPKYGYKMLVNGKESSNHKIYGEGTTIIVKNFNKSLDKNDTTIVIMNVLTGKTYTIETIKKSKEELNGELPEEVSNALNSFTKENLNPYDLKNMEKFLKVENIVNKYGINSLGISSINENIKITLNHNRTIDNGKMLEIFGKGIKIETKVFDGKIGGWLEIKVIKPNGEFDIITVSEMKDFYEN